MSRVACDVVVIGNELCGLAAAALIAGRHKSGLRVVVVDDGDPSLALPLGDRYVPTVPSLLRLSTQGPMGSLLDELGIKPDIKRVLGDAGGLGIIDDPDIRMVVPVDAESRAKELARVFGLDEGGRTTARLHDLTAEQRHGLFSEASLIHEDGFFEKRRQKKRVELLGPAGRVEEEDAGAVALQALSLGVAQSQLLPFVQSAADAKPRALAGLLAALQLQAGAHGSSKGGLGPRAALAEMLADVVRRHRGEVLKGAKVETIEADGKTITLVKATGANEYIPRVVVDATSRRDIAARLPEGRRREKLVESEQHVQPAGEAVSVRWLVPSMALPRGMPPLALLLRPEGKAVLVGVYAGAPLREGHKNVGVDESLVAVVGASVCGPGEAEKAAAAVEEALDHLLPFAKGAAKNREIIAGGAARAAIGSWNVVESEHILGGRRPQTPFANLLRAGRDLLPALGIEGELLGARSVASAAEIILGANKRGEAA